MNINTKPTLAQQFNAYLTIMSGGKPMPKVVNDEMERAFYAGAIAIVSSLEYEDDSNYIASLCCELAEFARKQAELWDPSRNNISNN